MRPDEFWSLTPREIFELAVGYQSRVDDQRMMLAWHAANVMNVHLKKKITPKKLLGKEKQMSMEDREAEFEKLKRALNERGDSLDGSDDSYTSS